MTAFIAHVGWEVAAAIVSQLLDGVDEETVTAAEQAAFSVTGAHHAHARARWLGRSLLVEIDGFVDAERTIAATDNTGRQVQAAVRRAVSKASAVLWTARAMPEATRL